MADSKISLLDPSTTPPADTDAFVTIENMATTPVEKRKAWSVLGAALKASPTFTGTVILPKTIEIQDTSADHQYVLAVSELAADRIITLPLLAAADVFVFADFIQTLVGKTLTTPIIATLYQDAGKTKLMTIPNTASDTLVALAAIQTLTNKRITPRTGTTASSATPTINTDNVDFYSLTAQAEAITSFTTNLSGTPTDAQTLWIAITGTAARAITWGTSFEASTVALPTTTVTTARLDVSFIWNSISGKWRCVSVA